MGTLSRSALNALALTLLTGAAVPANAQAAGVVPTTVNRASGSLALLLPSPPLRGSAQELAELAELHALIVAATPARLAQAKQDDIHEDPAIFDAATGRTLSALSQTWALLKRVQTNADRVANVAKDHFARARPWGVDPSLTACDARPDSRPVRSYPSGHAVLGYSVGYVLAQLMPARAPAILARAADYALSRQYCAAHFPSDTEASHVLGTVIAERLLADPLLARQIEAARRELADR